MPRGAGSWRPGTWSGSGWSATSTTERSSSCSPRRTRSGSRSPARPPRATYRPQRTSPPPSKAPLASLDELRALAHGLYPAILGEAGLAAALTTSRTRRRVLVDTRRVTEERYSAATEVAAYQLVVDCVEDAVARHASGVVVEAAHRDGMLVVTVSDDGTEPLTALVWSADRVGALGGSTSDWSPIRRSGGRRSHARSRCRRRPAHAAGDRPSPPGGRHRRRRRGGGRRRPAALRPAGPARRGRGGHPDAADAHRRGPGRRPVDPSGAPRHRRPGPLAVRRAELRAAADGGPPRARGLPPQGTRLRHRHGRRRAAAHRGGRDGGRPDHRGPAPGAPATARPPVPADRTRT